MPDTFGGKLGGGSDLLSEHELHSSVWRFFSNPIVGVVGSLASVVGLVLAVYFYLDSSRNRELTYMVYPAKTIVVKAVQTSRLSVTLEGRRLESDVTAAQVAFWNDGNEPIRGNHVLRPFVIKVDGAQIIEASIRKKSRDVVNLPLNTPQAAAGKVGVTWNILEKNDGGVVQLVFVGKPDASIIASAVIEGQPRIEKVVSTETGSKPEFSGSAARALGWAYLVLGSFMLYAGIRKFLRLRPSGMLRLVYLLAFVMGPLIIVGMAVFTLLFRVQPGPPFGF